MYKLRNYLKLRGNYNIYTVRKKLNCFDLYYQAWNFKVEALEIQGFLFGEGGITTGGFEPQTEKNLHFKAWKCVFALKIT